MDFYTIPDTDSGNLASIIHVGPHPRPTQSESLASEASEKPMVRYWKLAAIVERACDFNIREI